MEDNKCIKMAKINKIWRKKILSSACDKNVFFLYRIQSSLSSSYNNTEAKRQCVQYTLSSLKGIYVIDECVFVGNFFLNFHLTFVLLLVLIYNFVIKLSSFVGRFVYIFLPHKCTSIVQRKHNINLNNQIN